MLTEKDVNRALYMSIEITSEQGIRSSMKHFKYNILHGRYIVKISDSSGLSKTREFRSVVDALDFYNDFKVYS